MTILVKSLTKLEMNQLALHKYTSFTYFKLI